MAKKECFKRPTLIRFNTISPFPGVMELEEYKEPEQAEMPYVVDTSSFVPLSEAVKKVTGRSNPAQNPNLHYDFPDGRQSTDKIPVDRTHRFSGDIAEVSVAQRDAAAAASKALNDSYKQYQAEKAQADIDAQIASYNQPGATSE